MATQGKTEEETWQNVERQHLAPYKSEITQDMIDKIESFRVEIRKFEGCGALYSMLRSLFAASKFLLFYSRKLEKEIMAERRRKFQLLEIYLKLALGRQRARIGTQQRYNLRRQY